MVEEKEVNKRVKDMTKKLSLEIGENGVSKGVKDMAKKLSLEIDGKMSG
jgi:hypothetical protein